MVECPLCKRCGHNLNCPVCKGTFIIKTPDKIKENKRRNQKTIKAANRAKKRYNDKDIDLIKNYDFSAAQLAKKLGRSIKAIENARHRLKEGDNNGR